MPSRAQQSKRSRAAGAPPSELLFVLLVRAGVWMGLTRGRDLILDSAPILAWRRTDPDAAVGHAPVHHPRPLLLGYHVHMLLSRGTGLPLLFRVSTAKVHDAPFARPLLEWAGRLLVLHPRVKRLDAGYWGLKLIAWIHTTLGAVAVVPWNPKRQKQRDGLPPTWTAEELGKRTSSERCFGRVLIFFRLQHPPIFWLVRSRDPRGVDLRRRLGDRPGRLAGGTPRPHPLAAARPGPCLGGAGIGSQ